MPEKSLAEKVILLVFAGCLTKLNKCFTAVDKMVICLLRCQQP